MPSDDNGACFPSHATVECADGSVVAMHELRTGDRVRVSASEFSEVFLWTHHDASYRSNRYVRLVSDGGRALTATFGHMVPVCKGARQGCVREIEQVEDINVGDGVWVVDGEAERVAKVVSRERIEAQGLYNPQTMHGDIVVDGVLSTCYTKYIPVKVAHSLLMPVRAFYEAVSVFVGKKIDFY